MSPCRSRLRWESLVWALQALLSCAAARTIQFDQILSRATYGNGGLVPPFLLDEELPSECPLLAQSRHWPMTASDPKRAQSVWDPPEVPKTSSRYEVLPIIGGSGGG